MPSIRVKLIFERPLVKSAEQCWMLVDKNSCKMVHDLEYLIVKKFFVDGQTILHLYLDDFLLPSHEKIDLIRDNDVLRVIEDRNVKKSKKSNAKEWIGHSKKRKHEESSDSKRKTKKAKHSMNNKLTADINLDTSSITDEQLSSNIVAKNDLKTTENSTANNIQKGKHKNNKNSKINSVAKTKEKKKLQKKPSKDKSFATRFNDFFGKVAGNRNQWNPTVSAKKTSGPESVTTQAKDKDTSLSESAEKERAKEQALTKKVQKNNELQQSSSVGTAQRNQGSHIRFDDEENKLSTGVPSLNNAVPPVTHPQVLSLRHAEFPRPSGAPNLSPIEPNTQSCLASKKSVNGSSEKLNNQRRERGGKRMDSYTNRSQIMESTRVDKDILPQNPQPITASTTKKDFSACPMLHGPPRVGDTIVYKMIELSQSYTPEISEYKEGRVMSFDPVSQQFKLKLTKESLERVKGDGHVSSKFELFDNNEDDGQATASEELSDEVEIQWPSMLEPRLVVS